MEMPKTYFIYIFLNLVYKPRVVLRQKGLHGSEVTNMQNFSNSHSQKTNLFIKKNVKICILLYHFVITVKRFFF